MFSSDSSSERATSIEDYQNTCINFIVDISKDYKDWVDRYKLGDEETIKRKKSIDSIVTGTNSWIKNYSNTIKKVDIVMNDGVNKMAENTANYPFLFEVSVNNMKRYVTQLKGTIAVRINAVPRDGRLVRIGRYGKNESILLTSSSPVSYTLSEESLNSVDILNEYITLDASRCEKGAVISLTIITEELQDKYVSESRGYTTAILII